MEHPFIGVYWGPRPEASSSCAERIRWFLVELTRLDPFLGHWFRKGLSKATANREVVPNVEAISRALKPNRNEMDRSIIAELGYSFGVWNGENDARSASLMIHCAVTNPRLSNSAVIDLGVAWSRQIDLVRAVLEAAVSAFDPDNGIAHCEYRFDPNDKRRIWQQPAPIKYSKHDGYHSDG